MTAALCLPRVRCCVPNSKSPGIAPHSHWTHTSSSHSALSTTPPPWLAFVKQSYILCCVFPPAGFNRWLIEFITCLEQPERRHDNPHMHCTYSLLPRTCRLRFGPPSHIHVRTKNINPCRKSARKQLGFVLLKMFWHPFREVLQFRLKKKQHLHHNFYVEKALCMGSKTSSSIKMKLLCF